VRRSRPSCRRSIWGCARNGLGTYDDGEGYVLDIGQAFTLGYNVRALEVYSIVLGWHLTRWTTLRAEFSHQENLARDGTPALASRCGTRAPTTSAVDSGPRSDARLAAVLRVPGPGRDGGFSRTPGSDVRGA